MDTVAQFLLPAFVKLTMETPKDDSEGQYVDDDNYSVESYSSVSVGGTSDAGSVASVGSQQSIGLIAGRESKNVCAWRTVLLVFVLVAGVLLTTSTYIFLSQEERGAYQDSYVLFAQTIQYSTEFHLARMSRAYTGLSRIISASAKASGQAFPLVTIDNFEVYGAHARTESGTETLFFAPLVAQSELAEWTNYSSTHAEWIQCQQACTLERRALNEASTINPYVFNVDGKVTGSGPFLPSWQQSPPPYNASFVNFDWLSEPWMQRMLPSLLVTSSSLMSEVLDLSVLSGTAVDEKEHAKFHADFHGATNAHVHPEAYGFHANQKKENGHEDGRDHPWLQSTSYLHPHSVFLEPVFAASGNRTSDITGVIAAVLPWDFLLADLVPEGVNGIVVVLCNSCGQEYTYMLNGPLPSYLGEGDMHDPFYQDSEVVVNFTSQFAANHILLPGGGHCQYSYKIYTSKVFWDNSTSNSAGFYTAIAGIVVVLTIATFCMYDRFVQRRNVKMVGAAKRSKAILSSLYPKNVRDRLFNGGGSVRSRKSVNLASVRKLRNFMQSEYDKKTNEDYEGKPIADLFLETSVLFADIAGFTAWSSVREPAQVFTLLETLYRAFDELAIQRKVFKVETVGDCYVAVTGLPDPRPDHAIVICRYARDCMARMNELVKRLEVTLGPDTGDLVMRAGIHSGPVTGGVLRGERSRFQLFGDTMNTASRMESTGIKGCIQVSQETADLLIAAGKGNWLEPRKEKVVAKGKGEMQTYWLDAGTRREVIKREASMDVSEPSTESPETPLAPSIEDKVTRLIHWNVDVMLRLLQQIVARRAVAGVVAGTDLADERMEAKILTSGIAACDEVKEVIALPKFNLQVAQRQENPEAIVLPRAIVEQLTDFVTNIARLYNFNPFHNFEHASHVTMSVVKLLSRIVMPSDIEHDGKSLHDHTYGITSDPLTQFACVFSALIHDADHAGVPNMTLVAEQSPVALKYDGKSPAEQNSVDLAWALLMQKKYIDLRRSIYVTAAELKRFRQLVINSVMATDIVDKQLKELRNARWAKAFSESKVCSELGPNAAQTDINRKATIVIEHLIQASDVAHTMQHWHIYRKWNERFFHECYQAYKQGRAATNPADSWYKGEIGFFDFYIIPLAKKLKDCGVFGVSSDEYLNYAMRNRQEWEERGREVVDEMLARVNRAENARRASFR